MQQPPAQIQVVLLPDCSVRVQFAGPACNPVSLYGMLEVAKRQIHEHFVKAAEESGVEVAGPGLAKLLNGRGG